MTTQPISDHFDDAVCSCGDRASNASLLPLTTRLVEELDHGGLAGRTILEVGCGRGGLLVEMLRRGASGASGVDLSSQAVAAARRRIAIDGLEQRCTVRVGDGASDRLEPHDVVVLDRVICCYPDATGLLGNTIPAARDVFAFVVPASAGLRGRVARLVLGAENAIRRVRRDPFRAYVHDLDTVDRMLTRAGFTLRTSVTRRMWELRVHDRVPAGP